MSLKRLYGTDKKSEVEGKWIELGFNEDGTPIRLRITRAGRRNKYYAKALEKESRPYRAVLDKLDTGTDDKINVNVIVASILLDWENVREEDGIDIPFTKENATRILLAYPDLCDVISQKAWDAATFRDMELEDEAKN